MDNTSDTYCVLPFMAVDCHDNLYRPCCINLASDWPKVQSIEEYWHSETLSRLRKNLTAGVKDPACNKCWSIENLGQISMRQAVSQDQDRLNAITQPASIKQVKLITGYTCNLSCMMCFPGVSSTYSRTWQEDFIWSISDSRRAPRQYDFVMDAYIRQHAYNIEFIEVLGGESLFNKTFFELLDFLVEAEASKNITLFIITNGTLFTPKIKSTLHKFKKTVLTVSVDGLGLVNDYQRWPSKWSEIEQNLHRINDNFDMSILPTVTAINIIGLPRLLDFCHDQKYVMRNVSIVDDWPQLMPSNLPAKLQHMVSMELRPLLNGPNDPDALIEFIQRWDQKRQIDIKDFLPEWAEIL